ncbi:hypothetical protein P8452_44948 [Trifolium repens]|nr:hypothetical protein P8452_44948 [Trifolium repens]
MAGKENANIKSLQYKSYNLLRAGFYRGVGSVWSLAFLVFPAASFIGASPQLQWSFNRNFIFTGASSSSQLHLFQRKYKWLPEMSTTLRRHLIIRLRICTPVQFGKASHKLIHEIEDPLMVHYTLEGEFQQLSILREW